VTDETQEVTLNIDVNVTGPKLIITGRDLPLEVEQGLMAVSQGERVLGPGADARAVFDALPGTIARRLRQIIKPEEFRIAKLTRKLQLDVDIPGIKVGGDVEVTLEPV